jgi:transcription elongation factor GreA
MIHRPDENPELFLWMVRTLREGKWPELPVEIAPQLLFDAVMEIIQTCTVQIAHEVIDVAKYRGIKSRFENLLTENRQALIAEAFQELELEDARRRHADVMDNPGLNEAFKLAFDNAVRSVCYNLDTDDNSASSTESNEHFVTKNSFESRQKEYQQIKNHDIPANSKAIGEAAALGDLSENAEYHSAKERQKVLFRRKESLEDLLQRARTLEPDQVDTTVIGFGTKFKIRNQDNGKIEEYTLLGLWDADPEKNVLSYLTPFGKQFMKKKEGDTLVVAQPSGNTIRYEVLEIKNALK